LVVKSGADYRNLSLISIEKRDSKPSDLPEPKERDSDSFMPDEPYQYWLKNKY